MQSLTHSTLIWYQYDAITILLDQSSKCINAFSNDPWTLDDVTLLLEYSIRPGNATVSFSIPPSPTIFEREQKVNSHGDPYSGDWAIEQAFWGPELGELQIADRNSEFKVSFEKADATSSASVVQYQLAIEICNSFWTSFTIVGKMEEFDKIELTGHCASTRMMPSPDCEDMEQLVSSALSSDGGLKKLIVSESGQLIMSGPTAELICSRFIETFEPVRCT